MRTLLPTGGGRCNFAVRNHVVLPVSQYDFFGLAGRGRDRKLSFVLPPDADVLESSDPEHDAPVFQQKRLRRSSTTVECSLAKHSLCTTLAMYRPSGDTTLCPSRSLHSVRQPVRSNNNATGETNATKTRLEEDLMMAARHCIATRGGVPRGSPTYAARCRLRGMTAV